MAGPFIRRACMTVQTEHVRSSKWLEEVAPLFGVAIINTGSFFPDLVTHLRAALRPPKLILAYENIRDGMPFMHATAYDMRKRSVLEPGLIPNWHSYVLVDGRQVPGFVLRPSMAAPFAEIVAQRCADLGVDGLYVDQGTARYPDAIRNAIAAASSTVIARYAAEDYVEGRLLFSRAYQEHAAALGLATRRPPPASRSGTLIVNCRTETYDPYVTGVSLEGVTDPISAFRALTRVRCDGSIVWDNSGEAALATLGALDFVWIGSQLAGVAPADKE